MLTVETIKHRCHSCGKEVELIGVSFVYIRFAGLNGVNESTAELCPTCAGGFMAAMLGKGIWNEIKYENQEVKPKPAIIT